ncbi:N-acetylglucosamine kinase [Botrimarina hoheduenensis]|uniref:BadF/BadG/BcrA/BcrD ATPase family protein n=1 Tax=Botrimarina hoheduenensis TaxID=2528000 RepID=A0A5C5WFE6_9BACT|nr:BadF/BadG/BcrA/BcrD ATPase family protein [Botrimarina hoheduenensis]TWT48831.1 BadF/BadG/BcrA/BcrD ATPase family protein [Botrimarina hoheduenensis]
MSRLLLGIDGGGTKTAARIAAVQDGKPLCVLGSGFAGGSNPYSVGWQPALEAIGQAVVAARANAGVVQTIDTAVLAIAGCATDSARRRVQQEAETLGLAKHVVVAPDTAPLLADARPGCSAVGLIAGTGSIAVGRTEAGESFAVGGWGYLIDDAGSGFSLGRAALHELCRQHDAELPLDPVLLEAVLHTWAIGSLREVKRVVYEAADPRAQIATLAQPVLRCAAAGSPLAAEIAAAGAAALAHLAAECAAKVDRSLGDQPDRAAPEFYLAGGLLTGSPSYRARVRDQIERLRPGAVTHLAPDAACGCLLIGRQLAASRNAAAIGI